jgi:CTP synthase
MDMAAQPGPSFVVVTGGVCSSLGKGIVAASLGRLLVDGGHAVRNIKMDPYLNVDPGTMRPSEHGEVFVTADGGETDLDFGTYERFTGVEAAKHDSITAGACYWSVLSAERQGHLLGSTVQAVPHITDEIVRRLHVAAVGAGVAITEIGGTVGDIEVQVFLEAVRQLRAVHAGRLVNIHLVLVPDVGPNREPKTKPAQHSVAELRRHGITPDILIVRSHEPLPAALLVKLRTTCGVPVVLGAPDVDSVYDVPAFLATDGLDVAVASLLHLPHTGRRSTAWHTAAVRVSRPDPVWPLVNVALVGKYAGHDTYLSVHEAVKHAAAALSVRAAVTMVDAEQVADNPLALEAFDAMIVAGGFGTRGVEGKVAAARYAREHGVPYLGLCLGLQVAVIDAARSNGVGDAVSAEWGTPGTDVVVLMDEQGTVVEAGGTMRLGERHSTVTPGSRTADLYGSTSVTERHRHRYEVAPDIVDTITDAGLHVVGRDDTGLVEFVERTDGVYFHATQAHPEFSSRPDRPHPLFTGLIAAGSRQRSC